MTRQAWALLPAVRTSRAGQVNPTEAETLLEDLDRTEDLTEVMDLEMEVRRVVSADCRPMEGRLAEVAMEMEVHRGQVGLATAMTCCCKSSSNSPTSSRGRVSIMRGEARLTVKGVSS